MRPPVEDRSMTPKAKFAVGLTAVLAVLWFMVSWLVLNSPLTDAIGETAGSLAVALLVISIFGAARAK
jgi:hypothetical protein